MEIYSAVSARRTFRYNADWSHADEWEELTDKRGSNIGLKIINGSELVEDDICEHSVQWHYATFTAPVTLKDARAVIHGIKSQSCSCEHDCCGCWFGGAHEIKQKGRNGRKFIFQTIYSRNY